ncbi:MAG TPA: IS110 family transposase [Gemmataceae bacterium]|nr:IS110 family transposase [Gemmataceae bacterium]
MRFLDQTAASYVGVDLHARTLFLCVLDAAGTVKLSRNLPAKPRPFLDAIAPFRPDLLVGCECVHCWYWLADTCAAEGIPFALGHAWAMRAVHASKTKSDRQDAEAIARLLRGGNFPLAYAYPHERRGLRDLLRTRLRLVRQRAELYAHIHTVRRQLNLDAVGSDVKYKSKRDAAAADISDVHTRRGVEARLNLLGPLDTEIRRLERDIELAAQQHYPTELAVLQSIPGVGRIISPTVLLEIDTIGRFESRQQFCSYARLITPKQESAGKVVGVGNTRSGNAWLKWAFSEAAVLAAQKDEKMKRYLAKVQSKHGAGKGLSILAHKLGRVVYQLLHTKLVFDVERFVRG